MSPNDWRAAFRIIVIPHGSPTRSPTWPRPRLRHSPRLRGRRRSGFSACRSGVQAGPRQVAHTGRNLCSRPTLPRLEKAPSLKDALRLSYALADQWMHSYECEPASVTLDFDDACDVVREHRQLSLFNTHYDERRFLPIHVYDTERSRPATVMLRPGKSPSGVEVRAHLRRLTRHIRKRWPKTRVLFRGDGHYARLEAMAWRDDHGVDYVFGLSGRSPHQRRWTKRRTPFAPSAIDDKDAARGYAETRHGAKSWDGERRAIATRRGDAARPRHPPPPPLRRTLPPQRFCCRRNESAPRASIKATDSGNPAVCSPEVGFERSRPLALLR